MPTVLQMDRVLQLERDNVVGVAVVVLVHEGSELLDVLNGLRVGRIASP